MSDLSLSTRGPRGAHCLRTISPSNKQFVLRFTKFARKPVALSVIIHDGPYRRERLHAWICDQQVRNRLQFAIVLSRTDRFATPARCGRGARSEAARSPNNSAVRSATASAAESSTHGGVHVPALNGVAGVP